MFCLHELCLCTTCMPDAKETRREHQILYELELQVVVNTIWVLGKETGSFWNKASVLHRWTKCHQFLCYFRNFCCCSCFQILAFNPLNLKIILIIFKKILFLVVSSVLFMRCLYTVFSIIILLMVPSTNLIYSLISSILFGKSSS